MAFIQSSGRITFLRVNEVGGRFGPNNDFIEAEVIFKLDSDENRAFGFMLRADSNLPVREAMLDLLRDAFNNNWVVTTDFEIEDGKSKGISKHIWLTKPKAKTFAGVTGAMAGTVAKS